MQKALITGASGGIGKEMAFLMAKSGHDLVLVARNMGKLSQVREQITSKYDITVTVFAMDLAKAGSAKKLYDKTKSEEIEILVNNAGVGLKGNFFDDDYARTLQMTQLNMISLMELTYLFGGQFLKNNSGRILNIASIAAFFPGPKQPVYFATKSFVRSFSRALAFNLRNTGVTVTVLNPGVTKTSFFKSAGVKKFNRGASAESVARVGYKAMMAGKIEATNGIWNKFLTSVLARVVPYQYQAPAIELFSEV